MAVTRWSSLYGTQRDKKSSIDSGPFLTLILVSVIQKLLLQSYFSEGLNLNQNLDVVLIAFAVDSTASLENVSRIWVPEIKHFCPSVPFILVANKIDLRNDNKDCIT